MDRGTHTSSKIGWARVDVSVLFRQSEVLATLSLDRVSNSLDSTSKTSKDTLYITSLLHGDDSCLILLIDPEKEGLGSVVEDSTALGPVTLHTSNSEVTVSTDEEEVIINKLLPARSSVSLPRALLISFSTSIRCCLVIPGERPNPSMLRPTRIRVEWTGTPSLMFPVILEASMSEVCLASALIPW